MISVTITEAELIQHSACWPGLKWFRKEFPDGIHVPEWTQLHTIWAAVYMREWVGWARDVGTVPGANLYCADLRHADLYGADLSGARRLDNDHPIPGWRVEAERLVNDDT